MSEPIKNLYPLVKSPYNTACIYIGKAWIGLEVNPKRQKFKMTIVVPDCGRHQNERLNVGSGSINLVDGMDSVLSFIIEGVKCYPCDKVDMNKPGTIFARMLPAKIMEFFKENLEILQSQWDLVQQHSPCRKKN